ncbi:MULTISPECIES: hypothetical protein [Vibrio]|uniref:hypothetical protein n=1 Tax=Vibrio TaxID=662 RepID=UPI0002BA2502|nr:MULTISPECIES: hypothetical protein [Vibrio]EGR1893412.1 hypothetical protein [Vibrio vulnificus]EHD2271227.1 hypothetical protein [Vibrio cholerae]EKF9814207.1 hypothetical protein [Vibrio cholerae]EMB48289.1 hypothetical protein D908_19958 [Vibrio mimicus CAIM 602]MBY7676805.1 hypothetical protein [Vibrio mimicus]
MELDVLEKQLETAKEGFDSYESAYSDLEDFYNNRDRIEKTLALDISDENRQFLACTLQVMTQVEERLTSIYQEIENNQNDLTEQYAKAKYSLVLGDFVDYVDFNGKQCALRVEQIYYTGDKSLNIGGTKLVKSGKVGKMHGFFSTKTSHWKKRTEL